MTNEEKRAELRQRIQAAEARNEQRSLGDYAKNAADSATEFAKEHPLTTIAGAVGLGVLIASVVPGPGRRMRRRATHRASGLAALGAEMAAAYAGGLFDMAGNAARSGGEALEDASETMGYRARSLRRSAEHFAADKADGARLITRRSGRKASRGLRGVRARVGI